VQVVREVAQPAMGRGLAALVSRKHVVAGAAAALTLAIVGLAASHHPSAERDAEPAGAATVLAAGPNAMAMATPIPIPTRTPTPTPTPTPTAGVIPAPAQRPSHRLTKSPGRSPAAKVPGSRATPDDDDRIE
jgi:hypothetical protein